MTDKELLYVTTIAREGSVSQAARKLYITQPALSHCLAGIERRLGQPLFRRESRGLTLTCAGERYCAAAREILKLYGDLEQEIGEMEGLRRGRVLVGMTRFLSLELMPEIFPEYRKSYPGVELRLLEDASNRILELLAAGQLDLGVLNLSDEELEQMDGGFDCRVLYRDPFVIAAARGDMVSRFARPDAAGGLPVLDPVHLRGKPFATVSAGQRIRRVTDRIFRQAQIVPEIVFTSPSFETARRVACAGGGVTMLPRRYATLLSDGLDADYYAIPERYRAVISAAAVRLRENYFPAAAARFWECLERRFQAPEAP